MDFSNFGFFRGVASQFLKTLRARLEGRQESTCLIEFLKICTQLEVLDLSGFTTIVQAAEEYLWGKPGKTPTKLRLHESR